MSVDEADKDTNPVQEVDLLMMFAGNSLYTKQK